MCHRAGRGSVRDHAGDCGTQPNRILGRHQQPTPLAEHFLNRGKESVVLDLVSEAGRAALDLLIDSADVVLHNMGPGAMRKLCIAKPAVR